MISSKIKTKCKRIKLVITDVDGVLTDGGMYYTDKGDIMKKFFVRDGMGVTLLRKNKINTIIITKEKTKIVEQWSKKMKIRKLYEGIIKKESILKEICKLLDLQPTEIAFIGDDVNDLEIMKKVGFSATPANGIELAKEISDYVCKVNGGNGAFREVADLILSIKFPGKKDWY